MGGLRFCISLFFLLPYLLYGQKATYSATGLGEQISIAGAIGNAIHVWSSSTVQKKLFHEITTLTIHVFSNDMALTGEKKIDLGESVFKKIDFQFAGSFYYANILYASTTNRRLLLKIDQDGNSTDVTGTPGLWTKTTPLSAPQHINAAVRTYNSLFAIKIEHTDPENSTGIENASLLPGESFEFMKSYEKIRILKIDNNNEKLLSERVYASGYLNFSRPFITVTDSTVLACVFAEPETGGSKNPYKGSYMFIARLDTNLVDTADGYILLKNKKDPSNERYSPSFILPINKQLIILSTGQTDKSSFIYKSNRSTGITSYSPQAYHIYETGSLRITKAGERNDLLMDTVIISKPGREHLQWNNLFVTTTGKDAELFCAHAYSASKTGITFFSITQSGKMTEKDLIVNENYSYALTQANKLAPGILLVPFTYKRKTGLMKLLYETAE